MRTGRSNAAVMRIPHPIGCGIFALLIEKAVSLNDGHYAVSNYILNLKNALNITKI